MLATYQLTAADWAEAIAKTKSRRWMKLWALFVVGVFAISVAMVLAGTPGMQFSTSSTGWLSLLFPGFAVWFLLWGDRSTARSLCRKSPKLLAETQTTLTPEGIDFATPDASSHVQWSNYIGWRESRNLFLLYVAENSVCPIPKRAFGAEDVSAARDLFGENLGVPGRPKGKYDVAKVILWFAVIVGAGIVLFLIVRSR